VKSTPGRMMIAELLPRSPKIPFELVNRLLRKQEISQIIDEVYRHCGQKETVLFCDAVMTLGFREACKAGISFGKDDMVVPLAKQKLIDETRHRVREYEQQYQDGLTPTRRSTIKVVDTWSKCTDLVAEEMMKEISEPRFDENGRTQEMNSVYMMSHSGARGSPQQMKQLAGMRGLMARPSGEIIETPILSNFKEGLSVMEYFNSTHGARKGLADTALKTANSGYLTRRLVDVAKDCIITAEDCGTKKGVTVQAEIDGGQVVSSLAERILGRTTTEDVKHPDTGEVLIQAAGRSAKTSPKRSRRRTSRRCACARS
jgi:DNA-directed RNA polymerase subunit beta'